MISLVLGLGNIGEKYAGTRHSVGFEVLYRVEQTLKAKPKRSTRDYDWAVAKQDDRKIILARPKTYMNLSGIAAEALLQRNDLSPSEMLVVVDDFALPLGTLRFRLKGSDGGHNGLASLIETLGTEQFPRLRLGIGPLPEGVEDSAEFVLSPFEKDEVEPARKMIETAAEAVVFAIDNRLELAMSRYNSSPALPEDH
jgi:peptidyl-tRNA hydrolase, PTH1 family